MTLTSLPTSKIDILEPSPLPIIELNKASVTRGEVKILKEIDFALYKEESWTVLGRNGAGKSTLLRLLNGDIWPDQTFSGKPARLFRFFGNESESPIEAKQAIGYYSVELRDFYRRQKLNITALEVVAAGVFDTPVLYGAPIHERPELFEIAYKAFEHLDLTFLLEYPITTLSQGRFSLVLLARSIVKKPSILILDEPEIGLDSNARINFFDFCSKIENAGIQLVLSINNHNSRKEVAAFIKNTLILDAGKIVYRGRTDEIPKESEELIDAPIASDDSFQKYNASAIMDILSKESTVEFKKDVPVFDLKDVSVVIDGKRVLNNITWRMFPGEDWGVLGPNGAGKSVFFALLSGKLRPLAGRGLFTAFGIEDPPSEILKKRIGLVSFETQAPFEYPMKSLDLVALGVRNILGPHAEPLPEELDLAENLLRQLGLIDLADKEVLSLSYGQRRMIFLSRALILRPDILILDEPFSGLDERNISRMKEIFEILAENELSMLMSTHRTSDLPMCIYKRIYLSNGRIISK